MKIERELTPQEVHTYLKSRTENKLREALDEFLAGEWDYALDLAEQAKAGLMALMATKEGE